MAHPLHHAESSARRFGGVPDDYQHVHDWFDSSKEHLGLFVHRAQKHHTVGIYDAERVFGRSLINSAGRVVPIRWIGEQGSVANMGHGRAASPSWGIRQHWRNAY